MGLGLNTLCYDGVNLSEEYNCTTASEAVWNAPAKDVDSYTVPGRNGTVQVDNGRFENIDIPYECFCDRSDSTKADALRAFLTSRKGYCRLEDGYHPGEYRLASYRSGMKFDISGKTELVFDCKPQRYLKEDPIHITGGIIDIIGGTPIEYGAMPSTVRSAFQTLIGRDSARDVAYRVFDLGTTSTSLDVRTSGNWYAVDYPQATVKGTGYSGSGDGHIERQQKVSKFYIAEFVGFIRKTGATTYVYRRMYAGQEYWNDTPFEAKPKVLVDINGAYSGMIASINGAEITGKWTAEDVEGITKMMIDTESMNAYSVPSGSEEPVNMNKYVSIPDGFVIPSGECDIYAGLHLTVMPEVFTI